jgi:thioredoxin-like negative regulator of GroEL
MDLKEKIIQTEAILVLFGGAHCNVCQVIKPKIETLLAERFPKMVMCYVDCEKNTDLCAQEGVLSLPVVRIYFGGQCVGEWVRTFSLGQLAQAMERPYQLFFSS